jgi:hypothetical protein
MDKKETLNDMFLFECAQSQVTCSQYTALRNLARSCSSVTELGVYHLGSGFAILQGLSENASSVRSYLGIDIGLPPEEKIEMAQKWASQHNIDFRLLHASDFDIDIDPVDLLYIDTYHTYRHLTYELEKFSPVVRSYILIHDTSLPWGYMDENQQAPIQEIESRYPPHINRTKRGLWPAIVDFLGHHSEWQFAERQTEGAGYTILKRVRN